MFQVRLVCIGLRIFNFRPENTRVSLVEDQQRTCLVHLHNDGKGITYTDSAVHTLAPDNIKSWIKQRSKRWNLSCSELFILYWRILLNPKSHYLLKIEKAYQI